MLAIAAIFFSLLYSYLILMFFLSMILYKQRLSIYNPLSKSLSFIESIFQIVIDESTNYALQVLIHQTSIHPYQLPNMLFCQVIPDLLVATQQHEN